MSTLLFRGLNPDGLRVSGAKSFASEAQMKEYLTKLGIKDFEIFVSKTAYKPSIYSLVSAKELSIFCKQISVLFFSQITLMEGISVLAEQSENRQLKLALEEVYAFMEKGFTFSEAMRMYDHIFTRYLLDMIVIGETSGTLDEVFSRMSVYLDKESKTRKKIKSAVTYPAVLTLMMVAIVVVLIVKILPMFGDILNSMNAELPAATRFILRGGEVLAAFAPVIIIVIAAAVIAFMIYIRTHKGRAWLDKAKLSIPAYRYINSRVVSSRFARSLSILLKSGIQLLNALEDVTGLLDNRHLEKMLAAAVGKIRQGGEPAEEIEKIGVFPVLFMKMFVIGQKTGNLDDMLDKAASVFDEETDDAIERFTAMLEPLLIIILSVIVGVILLSVILPMISIMNAIG